MKTPCWIVNEIKFWKIVWEVLILKQRRAANEYECEVCAVIVAIAAIVAAIYFFTISVIIIVELAWAYKSVL